MKVKMGPKPYLFPMPAVLVGANVKGKPNFLTVGWCGIIGQKPSMISISLSKDHYTTAGIRENNTFSVNIPGKHLVAVTDFCGMVSGKNTDKSNIFRIFYGQLGTAPMIMECPVNLECRVAKVIDDLNADDIFIGEIIETYSEEAYMTNDRPDITKIDPLLFSTSDKGYWGLGEYLGRGWDIGRNYKSGN